MDTELNERIAVEVMGWKQVPWPDGRPRWRQPQPYKLGTALPDYSGTWEGMRLVVEEMDRQGYNLTLELSHNRALATFEKRDGGIHLYIASPTAPLAVCYAALDIVSKLAQRTPGA
jgi:hypothetical protein